MNPRSSMARRTIGAAAAAAALLVAGTAAAEAHVTAKTDSTAAGSTALVTLSVSHGCDGSSTTKLAIQIPAGINAATPTIQPGWTVTKVMQQLPEPVTDRHGQTISQRVDQVVYTAIKPLPDGYRAAVAIQLQLPEDGSGQTLTFPVIQTCGSDRIAWVQRPFEGQDPHELEAPAPTVDLTSAKPGDEHHGSGDAAISSAAETGTSSATLDLGVGFGAGGLAAGLAGLAAGLIALGRSRTRPRR